MKDVAVITDSARGKKLSEKTRIVISPLAFEAVKKIDAIFAAERDINGLASALRLAFPQRVRAPGVLRVVLKQMADAARAA